MSRPGSVPAGNDCWFQEASKTTAGNGVLEKDGPGVMGV